MDKLLFIAPDSVGIVKVIKEGLEKYTNYQIDFIDLEVYKDKFKYNNLLHRTANFFSKHFLKKNFKQIHYQNLVTAAINQTDDNYSIIFIIRPDFLCDINLSLLRKKTNCFLAYYWDSVSFFPRKLVIRHFFDKIYSFDSNDCKKYGFSFITNFYFFEQTSPEIKYQVYHLSTYDKRKYLLERVAKKMDFLGISYKVKCRSTKPFDSKYIERFEKILNYQDMLNEISCCKILLEIQTNDQSGLTFRPFEAMGLNKKLITSCKLIKEYDFYNPNNIFIIDDLASEINIPQSFFHDPYMEIPSTIKQKYHLKNWINTIINTRSFS